MIRRRPLRFVSLLALALYGAAVTALPLAHNAWHEIAHGHDHEGDRAAVLGSPHAHEHEGGGDHAPGHESSAGDRGRSPHDPEHAQGAPEHFGLVLGPAASGAPSLLATLAPARPAPADPTVFESSFHRTPANPRAPPA